MYIQYIQGLFQYRLGPADYALATLCGLGADHAENTSSNNFYIVACLFVAAEKYLLRFCLAMAASFF
jgi:hypothetical protein